MVALSPNTQGARELRSLALEAVRSHLTHPSNQYNTNLLLLEDALEDSILPTPTATEQDKREARALTQSVYEVTK